MNDDHNAVDTETLAYSDVLPQLRDHARADPGAWKAAGNARKGLRVEWRCDPANADTPETLRITRRLTRTVSEDLENAARALPRDLEIGPIIPDHPAKSLTIGLRPRTARTPGVRCPSCGAQPRLGTKLFGDAQRCAVCSVHSAPRSDTLLGEQGSVLIGAVILALLLAVLIGGTMLQLEAAERARGARTQLHVLDAAAGTAIETMTQRLRARAALRLGAIDEADIAWLNAQNPSLPAPGASLVPAESGFRIVSVREQDPIPEDAEPLDVWTDQPRLRYSAIPRPQGQTAARTIEVELRARVQGPDARRTLTRTVAISRLQPHPYAIYFSGNNAEFCQTAPGAEAAVAGAVRIDAFATFGNCNSRLTLLGTLEARDGIASDNPAQNRFASGSGSVAIPSQARINAVTTGTALLAASGGHARIPSAWGGSYERSRAQDDQLAGTGECSDRGGACGTSGYFAPGVAVYRHVHGAHGAFQAECGQAYGSGSGCVADVAAALQYHPWPWTTGQPTATAVPDPNPSSGRHWWRGLLFDPRREGRCTATMGTTSYSTHRCASNTYGFVLSLRALPAVQGGVLHVRSGVANVWSAVAGAQEALVIRDAEFLAGPLTLISDLPVFIVGSLNTTRHLAWRGPPPLMIDAPRITLLPAEADVQLGLAPGTTGWSSLWDVVEPEGSGTPSALSLTASANVTLYAVLRSRMCGRPWGTFTGDVLAHSPAVLGNWIGAEVRVVGAVEQTEDTNLSPAQCRWLGTGYGTTSDGSAWTEPIRRTVLHDPRLLHPSFRVPGSYLPANIPPAGVPGTANRTPARQAFTTGGYGVARITQETGRRSPRPSVALRPLPSLPPAPPALPH